MKKVPYLVQRLRIQDFDKNAKGIDKIVACEYMGSAEFEFGSLPQALRLMREHKTRMQHNFLKVKHFKFDIIAVPNQLDDIEEWIMMDINEKWRGKELSYLKQALGIASNQSSNFKVDTIGWWAIDINPPWIIIKDDKKLAKRLLDAIVNPDNGQEPSSTP